MAGNTHNPRHLTRESPWLLALLAAMVAMGPLSVDMYLPAMPAMMDYWARIYPACTSP